jgi:hypothetical protein
MKKHDENSVGKLLWKYIRENQVPIYDYLMKEQNSKEDMIREKITSSLDSKFRGGYSLKVGSHMNQFMVDYNIIRVLKDNMGFKSWSDISETEHGYCFKRYSSKTALPDWETTEEERY